MSKLRIAGQKKGENAAAYQRRRNKAIRAQRKASQRMKLAKKPIHWVRQPGDLPPTIKESVDALLEDFAPGQKIVHHTSQREGVVKSKAYRKGDVMYHTVKFPGGFLQAVASKEMQPQAAQQQQQMDPGDADGSQS